MKQNSFIGIHTDKEHDPSYEVTALIRTASSYSGGELHVYGDNPQVINQQNHSVFLLGSELEHEVRKIVAGYRNTLVVVLGKN